MRWRHELIFLPIASYSAQNNLWNDLSFPTDLWNNTIRILYILVSIYRSLCSHDIFVNSVIIPAPKKVFLLIALCFSDRMDEACSLPHFSSGYPCCFHLFFQMKVRIASKLKKNKDPIEQLIGTAWILREKTSGKDLISRIRVPCHQVDLVFLFSVHSLFLRTKFICLKKFPVLVALLFKLCILGDASVGA